MIEIKCEICGMQINEKNMMYNKSALLKQNVGAIVSCPFCGVNFDIFSKYQNDKEIHIDDVTLKILDHAMKLEIFNADFYKQASELAKELKHKQLFRELSNIELVHARIHQRMAGYKQLPFVKQIDYSRYNEDEILLQQAETREKHAVDFYIKYTNSVCSGNIKYIFEALSAVEKEHIVLTGA